MSGSSESSSSSLTTSVSVTFVVRVSQNLVLRLRVVMHVLNNRMRVVMMLVVDWHMDEVLLMLATSEASSTGQNDGSGEKNGQRLK